MASQHGFVGRGPKWKRIGIVEDLVIVRSFGVFTPAEKQLATGFEGCRLIEAIRHQVLKAVVQKHMGARVVSVDSDISAKSGGWMDVFALDRALEGEKS